MKFNNLNITISSSAKIGKNVRIGDYSVIYDNVIIEDNSIICNNCVIGEPLTDYYFNKNYVNPQTLIGSDSLIRSHTIIYAGTKTGTNFSTGNNVSVRENSVFGNNCRLGTLCDIQGDMKIGDYCWLHSNVHVGKGSLLGNFVFIYPYVVLTNDPYPPSEMCIGVQVGDFAQIATQSTILPGVKIGMHALIGAGSVVSKDVESYTLCVGNPARKLKDVREIRMKDKPMYPWPYRFDRDMPWKNIGYENWLKNNQ
jgi:acetyltransferase-like isoleucine patch superfamily enzyme